MQISLCLFINVKRCDGADEGEIQQNPETCEDIAVCGDPTIIQEYQTTIFIRERYPMLEIDELNADPPSKQNKAQYDYPNRPSLCYNCKESNAVRHQRMVIRSESEKDQRMRFNKLKGKTSYSKKAYSLDTPFELSCDASPLSYSGSFLKQSFVNNATLNQNSSKKSHQERNPMKKLITGKSLSTESSRMQYMTNPKNKHNESHRNETSNCESISTSDRSSTLMRKQELDPKEDLVLSTCNINVLLASKCRSLDSHNFASLDDNSIISYQKIPELSQEGGATFCFYQNQHISKIKAHSASFREEGDGQSMSPECWFRANQIAPQTNQAQDKQIGQEKNSRLSSHRRAIWSVRSKKVKRKYELKPSQISDNSERTSMPCKTKNSKQNISSKTALTYNPKETFSFSFENETSEAKCVCGGLHSSADQSISFHEIITTDSALEKAHWGTSVSEEHCCENTLDVSSISIDDQLLNCKSLDEQDLSCISNNTTNYSDAAMYCYSATYEIDDDDDSAKDVDKKAQNDFNEDCNL